MTEPILNPTGLIDRAALEFLRSKKLLPGFSHYDVWLYQHAVSFTVAKMMDADLLAETRAAIESAIANGTAFADFKQRLKPYLMSRGWWGEQVVFDPVDRVQKLVQLGSTRRLKVIFQTNMATAFAAGQWARIQSNKRALPYLRYNKSAAGRPRDSHRRYYGLVLPVEHPVWGQIFPPNGYGCQCSVSQLTRRQAEREGISGEPDIEMVEFTNPRTGQTVLIPKDITPSFAHNHGDRLGAVRALAAEKHGTPFADVLAKQADGHVLARMGRPNFAGVSPPLNVLSHPNIKDAQQWVYAYAGRGQQIGPVPVGHPLSVEAVQVNGRYYLLDYTDNGIHIRNITKTQLQEIKQSELKVVCGGLFDHVDWDMLERRKQAMQAVDFGEADFADKLAAFIYTTNRGYKQINPELIRHKGDTSKMGAVPLQLTRALDRLLAVAPKYQGQTVRQLATANIPDLAGFLAAHQAGNLVRYSNYSSTAKAGGVFKLTGSDIELTIHSRSGVDISRLSRYPGEGEVLLPRQAVYRVKNHTQEGGIYKISLEEVAEGAHNESVIIQLSAG